mgnify:CR=1 FL=1
MNPNPHILEIDNRQEDRPVDLRKLRAWTLAALESMGCTAELGIHLVGAQEMAQVNWDYLRHQGSTDVITFEGDAAAGLAGEICVSADTAARYVGADLASARGRAPGAPLQKKFSAELTLYLVHGWLHLVGYDDLQPAKKRRMRAAEARAMKLLRTAESVPEFKLL